MDGPKDPRPRVLSLPERFVGDPASLAHGNMYVRRRWGPMHNHKMGGGRDMYVRKGGVLNNFKFAEHRAKFHKLLYIIISCRGFTLCIKLWKHSYLAATIVPVLTFISGWYSVLLYFSVRFSVRRSNLFWDNEVWIQNCEGVTTWVTKPSDRSDDCKHKRRLSSKSLSADVPVKRFRMEIHGQIEWMENEVLL